MGRTGFFVLYGLRTRVHGRGEAGGLRRSAGRATSLFAALVLAACSDPAPAPGRADHPGRSGERLAVSAVDDAGRTIRLPRPAGRVVSLLPAGTETLAALGAADVLVGRTRYDTGAEFAHLPSVGGGLDPSLEALVALRPDLVVAWEPAGGESRLRSRLEELGIPVFAIQTRDTADVYANIANLGRLVGRDRAAAGLGERIRAGLDSVRSTITPGARPRVLFVVSVDPPMTAGLHNFIAELIEVAGGAPLDIAGTAPGLSPQVSLEEVIRRDPDVVLLPVGRDASMNAERLAREPGWRELRAIREGRIVEVPADLVNRPGPRLAEMARVLRDAIREGGVRR
jgi:iron complex transport system substrate-binding protein